MGRRKRLVHKQDSYRFPVTKVHPKVAREALDLAHGDSSKIITVSEREVHVLVDDQPTNEEK